METQAVDHDTGRDGFRRQVVHVDAVTEAQHALTGARPNGERGSGGQLPRQQVELQLVRQSRLFRPSWETGVAGSGSSRIGRWR
jgi:hypothetical protein